MADNHIPGLDRISPAYPIVPPRPADKERDEQKRKQPPPKPVRQENEKDDDDDKHTIDEYV